jgi:hypothetical protein
MLPVVLQAEAGSKAGWRTSWRIMMRSTGHSLFQERWEEPGT